MEALTEDQSEFAIKKFVQWMRICEDNNCRTGMNDVDHSSLLRRLLKGGKLHKNPPPKRFSYPAWELVEQEEIQICEFHDSEIRGILIDQHSGYEWEDKEKKIVRYTRLGLLYQYFEKEVISKYATNPEDAKYTGKFLRRLNEPTITGTN